MFADLVLVLNELHKNDPGAQFIFEVEDGSRGINVYSTNHKELELKNLSREALETMVRNGWYYSKDDEDGYTNYYFKDVL